MLKGMCVGAQIQGHKTNHSLRAPGAAALFEAGVSLQHYYRKN